MKRILWGLLIALMFVMLPLSGLAEQGLSACWQEGRIAVCWPDSCQGGAVLTVYKDNWPVLVTNVDCGAGKYLVPACYVGGRGSYSVRLRTADGCTKVSVSGNVDAQKPTTPAATATPVVTEKPMETAKPTATVTPIATAKPTAAPVVTVKPTATPKPTAKPTAAVSGSTSGDMAAQVIAQVNAERAKYGLGALTVDADLSAAACVRAKETVQKFSHTRPDGSSWSTVSGKAKGENIAMGYRSVDAAMAAWMSSEGHRANILRESFGSIGVCAYKVDGVTYWVQLFGR